MATAKNEKKRKNAEMAFLAHTDQSLISDEKKKRSRIFKRFSRAAGSDSCEFAHI